MMKDLSDQGRRAQAECLRAKGHPDWAEDVENGNVEYVDVHWLECLQPGDDWRP
jgi:hypothetical protein